MIWLAITVVIQIACVVHVIQHGRNRGWIAAIVLVPLAGAAVYFAVVIVPMWSNGGPAEIARISAVEVYDPKRELLAAQAALDEADTAANRIRVADGFSALHRYADALPLYREALAMEPDSHPATQAKLARALFETNLDAEALTTIEAIPDAHDAAEADTRAFLKAQILAHLGHREEALAIFADVAPRLPGDEARCHYAALLLKTGQRARARKVLEQVEARMKRLDANKIAADGPMYVWAMRELAKLKG